MNRPANRNFAFSEAFVDELARSGLHHACVCPGSRSTPLTMSLANEAKIRVWVHIDERSAAYFALGMSRFLREPVAVVSTSGTAAGNFFPAVIEAHYAHIPLVLFTADRPTELWEWGANQTIDQTRIYGGHVKWSANLAAPEVTPGLLRYVREIACRALSTAVQSPSGPVHINFPFGEPLVPESVATDVPANLDREIFEGREEGRAFTNVQIGNLALTRAQLQQAAKYLSGAGKGIIICGPQDDASLSDSVLTLANKLGYPTLADPLSQVRCGPRDRHTIVDSYDSFLRSEKVAHALKPEIILRLGATPRSKPLLNYIESNHQARQIVVQQEGDWQDPMHLASDMIQTDLKQFAVEMLGEVEKASDGEWLQQWSMVADAARTAIRRELGPMEEIFEGKIFAELATLIPSQCNLFVGNSMPVRDLDAFFPSTSQDVYFLCNRGASGIDGVLSSALGAAAATSNPTVVVIGDLSFYHDMNGLMAARLYRPNATVIVVNNNGGGVFSFLPQHRYEELFEHYFGTPHGLTFEAAASLYGLRYSKIASWQEFRKEVSKNITLSETDIVEVSTDRERNVGLHRSVWSSVAKATEMIVEQWS